MTVVLLLLCLGADVGQTCLRPLGVGILAELGIVVAAVAGDFLAEPIGADERFIGSTELNFSNDEAFVLAVELVDLEGVAVGHRDKPTDFVDGAGFAQTHEGERLVDADFFLELVAREAVVRRGTFDGEVGVVAVFAGAHSNTYRASTLRADVALHDARMACRSLLEIASNEEFVLYFKSHGSGLLEDEMVSDKRYGDDDCETDSDAADDALCLTFFCCRCSALALLCCGFSVLLRCFE